MHISLAAQAEASFNVYSRFEFVGDTESLAFSQFSGDWQGALTSGNTALAYTWFETGVKYGRVGTGYIERQLYYLRHSDDSARFFYLSENRLPIFSPSPYEIDIQLQHVKMRGQRFFLDVFTRPNFQLTMAYSKLFGYWLYDGSLRGKITALSEKDYDFENLQIDYYYSNDILFNDRYVKRPLGEGQAFDLKLAWQANQNLKLVAEIYDLHAYINWDNTPRTTATISSSNKTYDDNGYVTVHPLANGADGFEAFKQVLPWYGEFSAEMRISDKTQLLTALFVTNLKKYLSLGLSRATRWIDLNLHYFPETQAFAIGGNSKYLSFSLLSNDINNLKARHIGVQISASIPLFDL